MDAEQFDLAVSDLAEATRQFLKGVRSMVQAEYGLADELADVAVMKAAGTVAIECATTVALNGCE